MLHNFSRGDNYLDTRRKGHNMTDTLQSGEEDHPKTDYELGGFPERLREAIGNRSIRSFAAECGLSDTVLRQYLSGKSEPTRTALIAIAREAHVRVEWLVSGTRQMALDTTLEEWKNAHSELRDKIRISRAGIGRLIPENPVGLTLDILTNYVHKKHDLTEDQLHWLAKRVKHRHEKDLFIDLTGKIEVMDQVSSSSLAPNTPGIATEFVLVPFYKLSASTERGGVVHSDQIVDYLSFKEVWIKTALGIPAKDIALIKVKGDSMEPTLSNEDLVLIDRRTRQVKENSIYVLQFNESLLVKRIQRKLDETLIVKGDNPVYEPEVLQSDAAGTLNVIGRVVWCGKRM